MRWITFIFLTLSSASGLLTTAQSNENVSKPNGTTEPSVIKDVNQSTKDNEATPSQMLQHTDTEPNLRNSTENALSSDIPNDDISTMRIESSNTSLWLNLTKNLGTKPDDADRKILVTNATSDNEIDATTLDIESVTVSSVYSSDPEDVQQSTSPPMKDKIETIMSLKNNTESDNSNRTSDVITPLSVQPEENEYSTDSSVQVTTVSESLSHVAVKRHVSPDHPTGRNDQSSPAVSLTTANNADPGSLITPICNDTMTDVHSENYISTEDSTTAMLKDSEFSKENYTSEFNANITVDDVYDSSSTPDSLYPVSTVFNEINFPMTQEGIDSSLTTENTAKVSSAVNATSISSEGTTDLPKITETGSKYEARSRGQRSSEFKPSEARMMLSNNSVDEISNIDNVSSVIHFISSEVSSTVNEFPVITDQNQQEQSSVTNRTVFSTEYSNSLDPITVTDVSTELNKQLLPTADNSHNESTSNMNQRPKPFPFTEPSLVNMSTILNVINDTEPQHEETSDTSTSVVPSSYTPITSVSDETGAEKHESLIPSSTVIYIYSFENTSDMAVSMNTSSGQRDISTSKLRNISGSNMDMMMMMDAPSELVETVTSSQSEHVLAKHVEFKTDSQHISEVNNYSLKLEAKESDESSFNTEAQLMSSNKSNTTFASKELNIKTPPISSQTTETESVSVVSTDDKLIPTKIVFENSEPSIISLRNETVVLLKASIDEAEKPKPMNESVVPPQVREPEESNNRSAATDKVLLVESPAVSTTVEAKYIDHANVTEERENLTLAAISISSSTMASTTKTSYRIRKPKIRFDGDTDNVSAVIRRPTTTTRKPVTPERGGPVSIFNRNKTRGASITSSTTPGTTTRRSFERLPNRPLNIVGTEVFSLSLLPTTTPTTTTTVAEEEEEEEEVVELLEEHAPPHNQSPTFNDDDDVTLIKIAAATVVKKGLHWKKQLNTRTSPQYKEQKQRMHKTLERILRGSTVGLNLWKLEIDGFIETYPGSRSVVVDYSVYFVKTDDPIDEPLLVRAFNEKLVNSTFWRYTFDPAYTQFEILHEEKLNEPTEPPETEPPIPQWAIAVIVIGAASFIFIVLFAAVTVYGRHHMRRRYASKLDDDLERSVDSKEWEKKLSGAAAYENLAADVVYDADDSGVDNVKRKYIPPNPPRNPRMKHYDTWRTEWTVAPKRNRLPINHIIY